MPPHVQPKSLQELSIAKVGCLVFDAWVAVELKYEVNTAAEWSAREQTEVATLRTFFLSYVRPLFDQVCDAMCLAHVIPNQAKGKKCHHASKDVRILLSWMIHDGIETLHFGHEFDRRLFVNVSLSESQIGRLRNLVVLDFPGVRLTDKMLEGIGRACKRLEKINITSDPEYATLESLRNLLKCRKLEYVEIVFRGWKGTEYGPYIAMLITELPNLKTYKNSSWMDMDKILRGLTSATSLQELELGAITSEDFAVIIQKCPQLRHLRISPMNFSEACGALATLGESPVCLETVYFDMFRFEGEMVRLLEQKGGNLTKLVVDDCEGPEITLTEICAIGVNCPKLEHLAIFESRRGKYIDDPPRRCKLSGSKRRIVKRPVMFCNLVSLNLHSAGGWDSRVVLQILPNASRLTTVVLVNVFANGLSDILAEILNTNSLSELEFLSLEAERWFAEANPRSPRVSRRSIERLLERCPKLNRLHLVLTMEPEAAVYAERLKVDVRDDNLEIQISHSDPTESSDESEESDNAEEFVVDDDLHSYLEESRKNSALALL